MTLIDEQINHALRANFELIMENNLYPQLTVAVADKIKYPLRVDIWTNLGDRLCWPLDNLLIYFIQTNDNN